MLPPVFINGLSDTYQFDQYLFADRRDQKNQINMRLTENVGGTGCHGHRTGKSWTESFTLISISWQQIIYVVNKG